MVEGLPFVYPYGAIINKYITTKEQNLIELLATENAMRVLSTYIRQWIRKALWNMCISCNLLWHVLRENCKHCTACIRKSNQKVIKKKLCLCLGNGVASCIVWPLATALWRQKTRAWLQWGRSVVKYGVGGSHGQSGQAIKLFQITPYVSDFQTLDNPGSWQPVGASKN